MTEERQERLILVICGNYDEYRSYLRIYDHSPKEAIYIAEERQLRGLVGDEVEIELFGHFWKNKAYKSGAYYALEDRIRSSLMRGLLED